MTHYPDSDTSFRAELDDLIHVLGDVFDRYCRALARDNADLALDWEDVRDVAYVRIAPHLKKLPSTHDRRNYLFTIASHYITEMRRHSITRSAALSLLRSDSRYLRGDHSSLVDVAHRDLLHTAMSRICVFLPSLGFFRSNCYVLRAWVNLRYSRIAAIFEMAVRDSTAPDAVRAAVAAASLPEILQVHGCVRDVMSRNSPQSGEIDKLAKNLSEQGHDYWHCLRAADSERDYKRLRGWAYQVSVEVRAYLKTEGFEGPL